MARDLESYADGLVEETLLETATTFFGARVALEREIEHYHEAAEKLTRVEEGVLCRAATLHHLLLHAEAAREFYQLIGVKPGHLLDAAEVARCDFSGIEIPFAFTRRSRYAKLVLAAYAALVRASAAYLHGEYYTDSEGRKRVSVNFGQLQKWCHDLNEKITALNRDHSPTGTLCFVKGLDPSLIERQRLSEATLDGYAQELDRELAFKPVECISLNYLAAPELPGVDAVRDIVLRFARGLYSRAGAEARRVMKDLPRR